MKKTFYLKVTKFDAKILTTAIETGVDAIWAPETIREKIKELALVKVISENGDLKLGKDVKVIKITKKSDEDQIVKLHGKIPVIVENDDWTIIPLENLISKTTNIIQHVGNTKQAELALKTMERGASGICLETDDIQEILNTGKLVNTVNNEITELTEVEILEVKQLGLGFRCCLDTCSILNPGQGMLIGDTSSGMFLVYNENVLSPYCEARPFRVNAGSVHAYVKCPNDTTKYLSELTSGDEVLVFDKEGNSETVIIGRNKIEKRPMILIRGQKEGKIFTVILQNAETIRLTLRDGNPISVTKLKKGDKVLGVIESQARHFGVKIDETIMEK
ncbi:3-dehydroquinate synthase II [Candidatus Gracilibacteria bacterium]|nr:3-dehydroquinate synthase II [Candidatus Gracilibacteria bacterium]